jgi:thioredoxin-like negative regulator of GroEL
VPLLHDGTGVRACRRRAGHAHAVDQGEHQKKTALVARYGIRSISTLAVFRHGRELDRISGAMDLDRLTVWIGRWL